MIPETKPEQTNLISAALAAYRERQQKVQEVRRVRRLQLEDSQARLLQELLRERLNIHITPDQMSFVWADDYSCDLHSLSVTAAVDGLVFLARERQPDWDYSTPITERQRLYLVDTCEQCGERIGSGNIRDLADLGAVLYEWTSRCKDGCQADELKEESE